MTSNRQRCIVQPYIHLLFYSFVPLFIFLFLLSLFFYSLLYFFPSFSTGSKSFHSFNFLTLSYLFIHILISPHRSSLYLILPFYFCPSSPFSFPLLSSSYPLFLSLSLLSLPQQFSLPLFSSPLFSSPLFSSPLLISLYQILPFLTLSYLLAPILSFPLLSSPLLISPHLPSPRTT